MNGVQKMSDSDSANESCLIEREQVRISIPNVGKHKS